MRLCSAMLVVLEDHVRGFVMVTAGALAERPGDEEQEHRYHDDQAPAIGEMPDFVIGHRAAPEAARSEEHTSELQSLMRISYAVFCLKKKNNPKYTIVNKVHN